jgi:formate C-acetyltransferase
LWLKLSEWVWTISANTAEFFAGYNQFQNLTIGGKTREGKDAVNELSYMALEATEKVMTHQPGLSVRIHQDCPREFLDAVTHLVSKGTGFPAIHSDQAGYQRLSEDLVKTKRGQSNLGSMIQAFFALGAFHVQFNTVSTETLLDAQEHPENYKDLLVRVAGYSTQFVNLSRSMQNAIIARNAHDKF